MGTRTQAFTSFLLFCIAFRYFNSGGNRAGGESRVPRRAIRRSSGRIRPQRGDGLFLRSPSLFLSKRRRVVEVVAVSKSRRSLRSPFAVQKNAGIVEALLSNHFLK